LARHFVYSIEVNSPVVSENSLNSNNNPELLKVRQEVLICQNCPLAKTRTNAVPGEGDPNSDILLIGEAPGANEDKNGVPFCGQAGKFLDEMLKDIGLSREEVFITNTVKCRPPENRDPEEEEKSACRPYLERQFEIIKPKLIVLLGRHSMTTYLPTAGTITTAHGKAFRKPTGQVFLPLYHPAAALHNGGLRQTLIDDFNKIPAILKKIKSQGLPLGETKNIINKKGLEQFKLV
jgi:uracil-DNA glycosylase